VPAWWAFISSLDERLAEMAEVDEAVCVDGLATRVQRPPGWANHKHRSLAPAGPRTQARTGGAARGYLGNPTLKTLASRNPARRSRSTCALACCTVGN
jgi:hypothetical protein